MPNKLDVRKEIASNLRKALRIRGKRNKITVNDLCPKSGLDLRAVNGYFNGKREINFKELRALSNALNTNIWRLLRKNYSRLRKNT